MHRTAQGVECPLVVGWTGGDVGHEEGWGSTRAQQQLVHNRPMQQIQARLGLSSRPGLTGCLEIWSMTVTKVRFCTALTPILCPVQDLGFRSSPGPGVGAGREGRKIN